MTAQGIVRRCRTLYYIGLGEERHCGKRAVAILDAGESYGYPLCAECVKDVRDPLRLTWLREAKETT